MRTIVSYSIPVLALLCAACSAPQQLRTPAASFYTDTETARRTDSVMRRMTLDEKIGQLVLFAGKGVVTGATESKNTEEYIAQGMCGGVFNIRTAEEAMRLQRLAVEQSRLGIPMLFGFDVIHGFKTIFPVNIGISASWDIPAIEQFARISAEEAAAAGVNWVFSPMCDIGHDPRWGRVSEGAGEDPYLGSAIAAAMVRGYQGDDLSRPNTVLSCVKHFAAYGAAQAGRDYHTVDMSERMFRDIYLPPYKAGIDAGAATVMTSFNDFDGVPATANRFLTEELLRGELGFNGFVVTDYTAILELVPHGVAADGKQAAELAFNAGVNMDMVSNLYLLHGRKLVEEGKISEAQIDRLCAQIIGMKFRLGLFDDPYRYCRAEKDAGADYKPEHMEAARKLARSSMVLLENNGVLPLVGQPRIALIGPFGDAPREMLGSWVIAGEAARTSTFLDGLKARFGAGRVTFTPGCRPDAEIDGGIARAVAEACRADVVLLTLGLPQTWSGEAASLTSIRLPDVQERLLRAVKATGKPVVVLLVTARPLDLTREQKLADALLVTWNPGTMAGEALADVVSGDYNPSGKLTMTFPRDVGQIPLHYNMKSTGRPLGYASMSSQKYTSRYLFTPNEPLYPFGYGLSYTTFDYSDLEVLTPEVPVGGDVRLSVMVTNSGDRSGEEVVQLYIRDLTASVTRPVRELKGFRKILLAPGECRSVEFTLTPEELSFCRADGTHGQEPGDYHLWIGGDSSAPLQSSFTILPATKTEK
ncbi:MAG: glycoside hydrolase family 3 C-terminal domain-containing protein [Alistipes sp.]|nr:glycoside hydrolase family 3 C-terminal domain-containing protein [Alistipes sp.]